MNNTRKLATLIRPLASAAAYGLRFLPESAEKIFFKAIRRLINPSVSSELLEESLCVNLKNRGTRIDVSEVALSQWIPVRASLDVTDYIQRRFFLEGYPDFMPDLLRFCDSQTAFFDIGANIGMISLGVATVTPPGQIHSFEPVMKTFQQLKSNIDRNHPAISCHRIALSDSDGEISFATIGADSGSATTKTDYLRKRLIANRMSTAIQVETCPTQRFDTFWASLKEHPGAFLTKCAVKIDVEGHEIEVLGGMASFLAENKLETLIICETHWANLAKVRDVFESHAFKLVSPSEEIFESNELFGSAKDLVFRRQSATV